MPLICSLSVSTMFASLSDPPELLHFHHYLFFSPENQPKPTFNPALEAHNLLIVELRESSKGTLTLSINTAIICHTWLPAEILNSWIIHIAWSEVMIQPRSRYTLKSERLDLMWWGLHSIYSVVCIISSRRCYLYQFSHDRAVILQLLDGVCRDHVIDLVKLNAECITCGSDTK